MSRSVCAIGKDVIPASFKGVQFLCTSATAEGGRRGAEGEFPFGEDTAYADLGRKIRKYTLSADYREDDHVLDARALFMVCESPGPGLLVHPTHGAIMVACTSCKVTDAVEDEAGHTTIEMEFVEANIAGVGGLVGSLFGIISTALLATSQESFLRDYQPMMVSHPWRTDIINTAQSLIDVTARVAKQTMLENEIAQKWRDIIKMEEVVNDDGLAGSGKNVDRSLSNGFVIIDSNITNPDTKFRTMKNLANAATKHSPLPAGIATESEQAVLSRHRILAAVGMAESAMSRKYAYIDEALLAMDTVLSVFSDEARAAYNICDNPLFLELRKYSVQFAHMMNDLAYRLPGVVAVDFMGGVHPLVAAYAIYKDAKRHRDLETRNVIDANGRFKSPMIGLTPT